MPTFEDWLAQLDAEGFERGYGGPPLSEKPGPDYWRPFYIAEMSVAETLDGDQDVP